VTSDKNAIGYVSQDFVKGTNAVSYQGVGCTLAAAKSGEYGGVRNFWMVTRGHPRVASALQKWINWVQTSKRAQKIVATHWVPLI
jgi:phosphate transport system substrate-binding protein